MAPRVGSRASSFPTPRPFLAVLGPSEGERERMRSRAPRRTAAPDGAEAQGVRFGRRAAGPAEREQAERPRSGEPFKANPRLRPSLGALHA